MVTAQLHRNTVSSTWFLNNASKKKISWWQRFHGILWKTGQIAISYTTMCSNGNHVFRLHSCCLCWLVWYRKDWRAMHSHPYKNHKLSWWHQLESSLYRSITNVKSSHTTPLSGNWRNIITMHCFMSVHCSGVTYVTTFSSCFCGCMIFLTFCYDWFLYFRIWGVTSNPWNNTWSCCSSA